MGKTKYKNEVKELFEKSPVVSFPSIERIVKSKKNARQYARHLIKNMLDKGEIKRLTKGYYTKYNNPSLLVFCFNPSYLGLQDALSEHELWEQETIPVILTSKKARPGIRRVMENNILVRRINKKYLFGFDYHKHGKFYFPYSDIEKTFIDMLYFNEKITSEAKKNFSKKINKKKLKSYIKPYSKKFRKRILNIIQS